ncbi:MAG: DNA mismatch repair endonuclease MutL [Eubacteriales bacterium]
MIKRNKINILDESIAKKIAAGEIVEKPASVVKELIENAIDAKANNISIEIKEGGKELISISDNGTGIGAEDTKLAFIRHATSKISTVDDLYNIHQMGFRGEALYSISAVSKVTLITKANDEEIGSLTVVEGGEIIENHEYGCPDGTTIIVEDLFFNTPARKSFMKTNAVETANISTVIQKYILSYPEISFKFINNGKVIYFTSGEGSLKNAVFSIYGKEVASNIIEFKTTERNGISFDGCLGNKTLINKTRGAQTIFINKRYVKDKDITDAIEDLYSSNLMKHSHPFFVVNVNINPILVDVNVHPQKLNVVFSNPEQLRDELKYQLKPLLDKVNNQIIGFDTSKVKIDSKPRAHTPYMEFDGMNEDDEAEKLNEKIENENIEMLNEYFEEDNQSPSMEYEVKDFDYKSVFFGKEKADENKNVLKQTNVPINLQYEQADIKEFTSSYTIIGTAFNGYLFVECGDNVYIFDQHAAHERLIYERFIQAFSNKSPLMQNLLIPQIIDLPYDDMILVAENIESFEEVGYELKINDLSVEITGVPLFLGQPQMDSFFKEILADITENTHGESSVKDKIISMSCKKAVKAGDRLSDSEIKTLIDLILNEDIKLTCPHGRPFVSVITKNQIEKRFGRIV